MKKEAQHFAAILKGWGPTLQRAVSKANANRWPSGAPGGKGGQFAPGKGLFAPQYGVKKPLMAGATKWTDPWVPLVPKPAPPGAKPHPKADDAGKAVTVNYPSKPSDPATWHNPEATATFTPGGAAPDRLNGVAMKPWTAAPKTINEWANVEGQKPELDAEFPLERRPGKTMGSGVIVVEPDGRMWLTKPTNHFGGYQQTFPKGTVENGLPLQASAIKEAFEETGLKVRITGVLGDYERTTSVARFYIAQRVGGTPSDMGWESQAVRLAAPGDLNRLLNMSVDKDILADYRREHFLKRAPLSLIRDHAIIDEEAQRRGLAWLYKAGKGSTLHGKTGHWQQQERWPSGSPLGGQWKAMGGDGITLPPTIAGGMDGKNSAYQKKAVALHGLAQANNLNSLLDHAVVLSKKTEADKAAGKVSSHVKWNAQLSQYATQLVQDVTAKPKVAASVASLTGPEKLQTWTKVGNKPGGSNDGAVYEDKSGTKWLVKGNNYAGVGGLAMSDNRAKNEVLAASLMAAAGIPGPEIKLVDLDGQHQGNLGVAVKWIDGLQKFNPNDAAQLAAVQDQFAVHAWLGNWDVLGMQLDNTMFKDGKAINIDPGGSIGFRAQGAPKKEGQFDKAASDWESMRSTDQFQKKVYGSMTAAQLQESAKHLAAVSDDTINKLVDVHGPGDLKAKVELATTLRARRDAILAKAGLTTVAAPLPHAEPAPAPVPPKVADAVHAPSNSAPPADLKKPTFKSGLPSDPVYKGAANQAEAFHKAGDLAGLMGLPAAVGHTGVFQGTTYSSNKLVSYHAALVADLQAKQQTAINAVADGKAAVKDAAGKTWTADKGVLNPTPAPVAAAPKPALPDFSKSLLPMSNSNWPSHNAKVAAIQALARDGNVAGILSLKFGTNTYAVKQVKLANDCLAALGSPHKVTTKQAASSHPALVGGLGQPKTPAGPAVAAAAAAQAAQAAGVPTGGTAKPKPKLSDITADKLPPIPDVMNFKGPGSPYSSKQWKNDANKAALQAVFDAALKGGMPAVDKLRFPALDANTGAPLGHTIGINEHPAKSLIGSYVSDVNNAINDFLNPPMPMHEFHAVSAASVKDAAATFLGAKIGNTVASMPKQQQFGFWLSLGNVTDKSKVEPLQKRDMTTAEYNKGKQFYQNYSSLTKQWISKVQGSGQINRAIDDGAKTYAGLDLKAVTKAIYKDANELPAGSTIYRHFNMPSGMLKQIDSAPEGLVFQSLGGFCCSAHPTKTTGFGPNTLSIRVAAGAKAVHSHGSGQFANEMEITTIPGQRYVLLSKTKKPNGKNWHLELLMLPPDENFAG